MAALQELDPEETEGEADEFPWTEPERLEWTLGDKTHDQFRDIDWSHRPGLSLALPSKRARDSAAPTPGTNQSRAESSRPDAGGSQQPQADGDEDKAPVAKKPRRSDRLDKDLD